jgi:hypothetical protein
MEEQLTALLDRLNGSNGMDAPRRYRCAKAAGLRSTPARRASKGEVSFIGVDLVKNVF